MRANRGGARAKGDQNRIVLFDKNDEPRVLASSAILVRGRGERLSIR